MNPAVRCLMFQISLTSAQHDALERVWEDGWWSRDDSAWPLPHPAVTSTAIPGEVDGGRRTGIPVTSSPPAHVEIGLVEEFDHFNDEGDTSSTSDESNDDIDSNYADDDDAAPSNPPGNGSDGPERSQNEDANYSKMGLQVCLEQSSEGNVLMLL
jgi:hypothetical protein